MATCASCGAQLHKGDDAYEQDWAVTRVIGTQVTRTTEVRVVCTTCATSDD